MNYSTKIDIDLPIERVIELFDSSDNLPKWQPQLESFEHVSGEPGKPGAKSKMKYKMGKREIEMIETITVNNLPDEFSGTYDAKGVHNLVQNRFVKLDENKTEWISENTFEFSGFMSIMSKFMSGAFKKQTQKYLQQFKDFAEAESKTK